MTSYYAGFSLREIYERKCIELQCRKNSAISLLLSDVPDEFHSLQFIDLSKNFLGPKGILPLLEIIRCCRNIYALDLRAQQLDDEAVGALCLSLRQHPSIIRINLSDNPLTMAAGTLLLQLAKENTTIQYIILDKCYIRPSLLMIINGQLERNRTRRDLAKNKEKDLFCSSVNSSNYTSLSSEDAKKKEDNSKKNINPENGLSIKEDPLNNLNSISTRTYSDLKRLKTHDVEAALLSFSHTIHEVLFDENPVPAIAQLCEQQNGWFYDTEFAPDDMRVQHRATSQYGISGWRRIGDIYPSAKLFPNEEEENNNNNNTNTNEVEEEINRIVFPKKSPLSFSWIFTCLDAVANDLESLRNIIISSPFEGHNIYALRVHIDGSWRYVIVDDFLPVNNKDELIFTYPVDEKYFWPCILEKALAKMHGGYSSLDLYFADAPKTQGLVQRVERNSKTFLNFRRSTITQNGMLNHYHNNINNERKTNCAKTLSDLSGGVGIVRFLHNEFFRADTWWLTMLDLFSAGAMMVALSVTSDKILPGIEPYHVYRILQVRQINGVRLLEISSMWATVNWKGDWSEESSQWARHRDIDAALRGGNDFTTNNSNNNSKNRNNNNNNNAFWISYPDFILAFSQVHLCHIFTGFQQRIVEGEWDRNSSGGASFEYEWYLNPHYRLKINQESPFFINLAVPDTRFTPTDVDSLGFHIIQSKHYPLQCKQGGEQMIAATNYVATDSISFEGIMKAGEDYWVIPSSHTGGVMGKFLLRIFSQSGFIIWKDELSYCWNTITHNDTIECSGEYCAGDDNTQLNINFEPVKTFNKNFNNNTDSNNKGAIVIRVRTPETNELALGLFLVKANLINSKPSRNVGVLRDDSIIAASNFIIDNCIYLEAEISQRESYNIIVCVNPIGSKANLEFTIWSSFPTPQITPLPVWGKKSVKVSWPNGSGSYYEVTRNPQVEIYPIKLNDTIVIRMHVTECSYTDPAIVFFLLSNNGRQGEGIKGKIPADKVLIRSQYVRHHLVQCEYYVENEMDSILIIPCLQPAGSFGECTICVATESGEFNVRALSTI